MASRIDVSIEHRGPEPEPPGKDPNTCPSCHSHYRDEELDEALWVCPQCGHHFAVRARRRVEQLADRGTFEEQDKDLRSADPLGFFDLRAYTERIAEAEMATGLGDAIIAGAASIERRTCELAVMDFAFMGGSMGSVVGEKIARLGERSLERKYPLVLLSASGGARMQEGVLSLMQMAKTSAVLAQLAERRIPYVSILTNPTTGGVSASFAMLGDAILAEPGAVVGFAGPRVIKQTIGQDLPEGFQTSEFLLDHGMLDAVVHRRDLKRTVGQLLRHMSGQPAAAGWTPP
jgi:acetyl-CoA carboxylase carboxyl transferase subunit beta